MKIYIDENFICRTTDSNNLTPIETDFFNGKCSRYIEGYRFVPAGQTWTRPDGVIFHGEMISPAEDIRLLEAAQKAYEQAQSESADALAALEVLGVSK